MPRRELSRGLAVALAVVTASLLAGCGGGGRHRPATRVASNGPAPRLSITTPLPVRRGRSSRAHHTVPQRSAARSPALRHLQAALVRAERRAGRHTGLLVYDMTTGQTLFSQRAGVARPPASVAKIYTSVALLRLLGPQARLHTDLLGTGHLGSGGVWHGNLYLRGDGDPTFGEATFDRAWEDGYGSLVTSIVAQLRADGVRRVTGLVYGDGSRFSDQPGGPFTDGQPDIPDYGGELSALTFDHGTTAAGLSPPAYAARQLVRTMRAQHMRAKAASHSARTPVGARLLASVSSPPLSVLLRLMDVPSDDLFADMLTEQLGYRFRGHGTLAAGAREILWALRPYHVRPRLHDGSGLDPSDRTTPSQVVSLLRQVWSTSVGHVLDAALPVVGVSGTVQSIAVHTAAQGRCVAKTGTLNDVTNLAGVCSAVGGNRLVFGLFVDGPANWVALPILGRMVAAIASY